MSKYKSDIFDETDNAIEKRNTCIDRVHLKKDTTLLGYPAHCFICGKMTTNISRMLGKTGSDYLYPLCDHHADIITQGCINNDIPFPFASCYYWNVPQVCPRFSRTPRAGASTPITFHDKWTKRCHFFVPLTTVPLVTPAPCYFCQRPASVKIVKDSQDVPEIYEIFLCEEHEKVHYRCLNTGVPFIAPCVLLDNNEECIFFEELIPIEEIPVKLRQAIAGTIVKLALKKNPTHKKVIKKQMASSFSWYHPRTDLSNSKMYSMFESTLKGLHGKIVEFEGKYYAILSGPSENWKAGFWGIKEVLPPGHGAVLDTSWYKQAIHISR